MNCFVIMPFGGKFDSYYTEIIIPVLEEKKINPIRADEIYGTKPIIEDIINSIKNADILIADVTGKNPNVNYELGYAHALNKKVIIITQKLEDVPFDYKHNRIIIYETTNVHWVKELKENLKKTIEAITANDTKILNKDNDGYYTAFITKVHTHAGHSFYCLDGLINFLDFNEKAYIKGETHWLANWNCENKMFQKDDKVSFRINNISDLKKYDHAPAVRNINYYEKK